MLNFYKSVNHDGWFLIDKHYRLLETKFAEFDIGSVFDDKLERFIAKIRNGYSNFIDTQAERVSLSLSLSGRVEAEKIIKQKDIFKSLVLPALQDNRKCAYFLVDAFRYEMGEELFESIESCEQKNTPSSATFG